MGMLLRRDYRYYWIESIMSAEMGIQLYNVMVVGSK